MRRFCSPQVSFWFPPSYFALLAALVLVGPLACLAEEDSDGMTAGGPGFGPGPAGVGPARGGQAGGPPYAGMYTAYKKTSLYLWADGHFAFGIPAWGADAKFDFERTAATFKPSLWGTYRTTPSSGDDTSVTISFAYEDGETREDTLTRRDDGGWRVDKLGLFQIVDRFKELDGTFKREWSTSVGGDPAAPGATDPELTVGKYVTIKFMPNQRFHYMNSTQVTVDTYIGGSLGGRVYEGTDFLNSVEVNEGGHYSIEDRFLRLTFDSGPRTVSYFEYLPSVKVTDDHWTSSFLKLAGHTYACPGQCIVE